MRFKLQILFLLKKTKQLLNKIFTLTSAEQAKKIKSQVYVDNRPKCKNEELYYTIDKLDRAINDNRKVKIIYRRRILSDNPDQAYEEKRAYNKSLFFNLVK